MGDARNTYILERLEQGLEGWKFTPSVSSLLEQPKSKQVVVYRPLETRAHHTSDGDPIPVNGGRAAFQLRQSAT